MIIANNLALTRESKNLFTDATFHVPAGAKAVLTGPSGCGKSSLLLAITGILPIHSGSLHVGGIEVSPGTSSQILQKLAYVGQEPQLCCENIRDAILLPFSFRANRHLTPPSPEELTAKLSQLQLPPDILEKKSSETSGGEKQRIAIVRSMLLQKKVFLLDEITSALDEANRNAVASFFCDDPELTFLSVSHSPEWIARCNLVLEMNHTIHVVSNNVSFER